MSASPRTNSAMRKLPMSIPPKGQTTAPNAVTSSQAPQDAKLSEIPFEARIGVGVSLTGNRVLIKRIEEESDLALTDKPKSIKGIVLVTGPGKWHPGEWWYCKHEWDGDRFTGQWDWIDGWREPIGVHPGQLVLFNSRWNDLAHAENIGTGADGKGPLERPLSYKFDPLIHLVTEDDIFCILSEDVQVSYVGTAVERQYFKNTTTAEECFTTRVGPR